MEEKDYALISDRELVDRLLIGDEEIVRYLFFDKCTPMFNYILHRFCPCQLDKNELINELYLICNRIIGINFGSSISGVN